MTRIMSTKTILGGKKRIAGTRISVDLVASYLSQGYGVVELKRDYPHLTIEQIQAAIDYLDKQVRYAKEQLVPSAS